MAYMKFVFITCDYPECDQHYDTGYTTITDARLDTEENGWSHVHGKDLCPQHWPFTTK